MSNSLSILALSLSLFGNWQLKKVVVMDTHIPRVMECHHYHHHQKKKMGRREMLPRDKGAEKEAENETYL